MSPLPAFPAGEVQRTRPSSASGKASAAAAADTQPLNGMNRVPAASPPLRPAAASSFAPARISPASTAGQPLSSPSPPLAGSASSVGSSGSSASRGSPALLGLVFVVAAAAVVLLIRALPPLTPAEWSSLRFPRSHSDVLSLSAALSRYRSEHPGSLVCVFVLLYVFMQSFAIPGPVFLSLLAGPLFGFWLGLLLVSVSACGGACVCYWLSYALARSMVERCFPGLLAAFRRRVEQNRASLVYQLVFLRISPLLPNWFINLSSAHLNVPFGLFAVASVVGLLPANYLHVSTGMQLQALGVAGSDAASTWRDTAGRVVGLFLLAFLALVPTLWTKRRGAAAAAQHSAADSKSE